MRQVLMGTVGLIVGAGAVVLAGGGVAAAQSGGATACQQVGATLSNIQQTLPQAAANPSALVGQISTVAAKLGQEASSGSPALKSAVNAFLADLQAAGAGNVNVGKLTADAKAIGAACTATTSQALAPKGAPATGGGGTAGVQDAGLFVLGGAALLAGAGLLAADRRARSGGRA